MSKTIRGMTPIDTADLERAIAAIKDATPAMAPWCVEDFSDAGDQAPDIDQHIATILNAVVSGDLVLAHRKAEAWQPISSAPKDGTTVMVYVPDFEKITEAWFCEQTGLWPHSAAYSEEGEPCNVGQPTHWRPLPAPPTTPEAEGGSDD
ncbi:DUF551 domain-containing protein [Paracoccus versutus]|uniref:Uncharacterized protein DUF551 n=1 Tax=Paracoccus versutus TaxID=34007 RepID=A0A3D9XL62_PARVE|nr:DUF551 domain-containing protein [Paracoccus versutus]REF70371.1 uncharacterized protein DUF551 [Paracoccus versutus]